jgi:hypothetical protein
VELVCHGQKFDKYDFDLRMTQRSNLQPVLSGEGPIHLIADRLRVAGQWRVANHRTIAAGLPHLKLPRRLLVILRQLEKLFAVRTG